MKNIQKLKEFKEMTELRKWYWNKLAEELFEESVQEIKERGDYSWWKRLFGIALEEIKELQHEKFEEIWSKINQKTTSNNQELKEGRDR